MPDPALESLYSKPDSTGLQAGDPGLERLYAAVAAIPPPSPHPGVAAAEKVAGMAGDLVGNVMRFFGKRTSAGTAAVLEPLATPGDTPIGQYAGSIFRGVTRGESPYPGVLAEQASAEFFRRHPIPGMETAHKNLALMAEAGLDPTATPGLKMGSFLSSPEGNALAAETALGLPLLNKAMAPVAAAGKVAANAEVPYGFVTGVRRLPGIKQASEFVSTGASLPNAYRQDVQRLLRMAEGEADFAAYQRLQDLGEFQKLPVKIQDKIQTAIERRLNAGLSPEEVQAAQAVVKESERQVQARVAEGGRANVLGAQADRVRNQAEEALTKLDTARAGQNPVKVALAEKSARRAMRLFQTTTRQKIATGAKIGDTQAARAAMDQALEKRVSYTARSVNPDFLKSEQLAKKPYGAPLFAEELGPAGLGTGRMARRVSNPELTTQEINAAALAEGKPRPIRPLVESTILKGQANDVRVMNLKIVGQLAKKYGSPTKDPAMAVGRHYGVETGFTSANKAMLDRTKLPPELDELVSNLNRRLQPANWTGMNQSWRWMNSEFKRWALFSPGFVSRNMQNNVLQTLIYGNVNPRTWERASQVNEAMRTGQGLDNLIKVGSRQMKVRDYIEDAIKRGIIGRGQVSQEVGTALEEAGTKGIAGKVYWPHRKLRDINQFGEDVSRTSFDLFNQGKGMSPLRAAERVDEVLFNYSNRLAHPVRMYLRRNAVPFINWHAQIGPLFARTALERPGQLGVAGAAIQRQNEKMGFPEGDISTLGPDVVEQGGIVTGKGKEPGTLRALEPQMYGGYSLNQYVPQILNATQDPKEAANALAQLMYPQFSVPAGLGAGRDILTGKDFTGKPATAPQGLKALWLMKGGPEFAAKFGIFVDKDGTMKAPDRLAFVLRSIPPARLPSVLADWVSAGRGSETRVQSFLTGVREIERSPEVGRSIQGRKQREQRKQERSARRQYPPEVQKAMRQ